MNDLAKSRCVACRSGDPPLTDSEIAELHPKTPDWEIVHEGGIQRIKKSFKFKNFVEALDFANRVGAAAEEEDHHPMLVVEWGKVTVQWWTHVVKGLHRNDFIMAAKTDQLA